MKKSTDTKNNLFRSLFLGAVMGIGLAMVFGAGFVVRDLMPSSSVFAAQSEHTNENNGYILLDEVQAFIDGHYLRKQPDYSIRQYGAVRGMLNTLGDRNTFFIDPPVARSESDVLAGTYGGIGVSLQRNEAGELVLFVFPDSPAERSGIMDGDILVAVNSQPVAITIQQDVIDQMLRGEVKENNGVEITIKRDELEITEFILFDVINVPSVLFRTLDQAPNIGYLQIIRFTSRTPEESVQALAALFEEDIEALVLDLRNNSGGLLQESIEVADIFLDGGIVLIEQRVNEEETYTAEPGGDATSIPIVVLVNGGTASASELVAGAIRDRDRGILIGQTTFGKGTIQQIFPLSDGSSIHITSAEWFTPGRNRIDGVGLTPDIPMIPDENGRDVEIGEAMRYLQSEVLLND